MLQVQTYLLTHSLQKLLKEHGVKARFSEKNPRKFSLNYDEFKCKKEDPIAQECRGLVLQTERPVTKTQVVGPTEILAHSMHRFFNYQPGVDPEIVFTTDSGDAEVSSMGPVIYEKLDGTLCIVYWDPVLDQWCVGTRAVSDGDVPIAKDSGGFSDLFWKAFRMVGASMDALNEVKGQLTFCFELCTPENKIVVEYNGYQIYLLAVVQTQPGPEGQAIEQRPEPFAKLINVPPAPTHNLSTTAGLLDFVSCREPSKYEGVVVYLPNGQRYKIKNPSYLTIAHARSPIVYHPKNLMEAILAGHTDDMLPVLNQGYKTELLRLHGSLRELVNLVDTEYTTLYCEDRKTFFASIKTGSGFIGPHLDRHKGLCTSMSDWFEKKKSNGTWPDSFLKMLVDRCSGREPELDADVELAQCDDAAAAECDTIAAGQCDADVFETEAQ